jgi:hypothetical protein
LGEVDEYSRVVRALRGQGWRDSIRSQRAAGGAVAMRESPRRSACAAQPVSGRYLPSTPATLKTLCGCSYQHRFGEEAAYQDQLVGVGEAWEVADLAVGA